MKLLIISDLWGFDNLPWIKEYEDLLKSDFQLVLYDSCELAGIDKSDLTESELHSQFLNGGVEVAVNKLLEFEKEVNDVLAFSIGGLIAWNAQLQGLKTNNLFAISSTRLRYEMEKPNGNLHLYYGERDLFKPEHNWFNSFELIPKIFDDKEHKLYTESECIREICSDIRKCR